MNPGSHSNALVRLESFPLLHEPHAGSYRVWASAELLPGELKLQFKIEAAHPREFSKIYFPEPAIPSRVNELWKDTCFECFVPSMDSEAYLELNFSPSGCWNAYAFQAYREGMTEFQLKSEWSPRQVIWSRGDQEMLSEWVVPLTGLRQGMMSVKQNELKFNTLGLSTVLNTSVGTTYWALKHEGVKPDFHLRSSFSYPI